MAYQLSPRKVKKIKRYCDAVYDNNRKFKVRDNILDSNRTGKEINLQGLGAEIWFKEKYDIPYTLFEDEENFIPRTYKKDIDCIFKNGLKLELKQTMYPKGCFFIAAIDHWHKPRKLISDMYVLIVGSFPFYKKDLFISKLDLVDKYLDRNTNRLCPTIHPKIGKAGYHMEQDEMYNSFEEALETDGRRTTTSEDTSTMS